MALIKCHECGHEIADTAKQCPNCGSPTEYQERVWETKKVQSVKDHKEGSIEIGMIILIIIFIANFFTIQRTFERVKDNEFYVNDIIGGIVFFSFTIIGFYFISYYVIRKISKKLSNILLLVFSVYLIGILGLNLYWYLIN